MNRWENKESKTITNTTQTSISNSQDNAGNSLLRTPHCLLNKQFINKKLKTERRNTKTWPLHAHHPRNAIMFNERRCTRCSCYRYKQALLRVMRRCASQLSVIMLFCCYFNVATEASDRRRKTQVYFVNVGTNVEICAAILHTTLQN